MSLLTKGGAGKSLPQGAAADAANAVQNAIGQLADKYGVDRTPTRGRRKGRGRSRNLTLGSVWRRCRPRPGKRKKKGCAQVHSQETFDMAVAENMKILRWSLKRLWRMPSNSLSRRAPYPTLSRRRTVQQGPVASSKTDAAKDVGEAIAVLDELRTTVEASDDDRLIAGSNDACLVFGCGPH